MNGNPQSLPKSTEQKIAEFVLEFETSLGLLDNNNEAVRLMNLKPEEMKKLSAYDAAEAALVLSQYAIFIQNESGKLAAKIKACQVKINKIIVSQLSQQKAYSYEEKRLCAIKNDTAASEVFELQGFLEVKLERISFLSSKIQHYSDKFSELCKTLNKRNI